MPDVSENRPIDQGMICEARHGSTPFARETLHMCSCEFSTHTFCGVPAHRILPYLKPKHYGLDGAEWCRECPEKHTERMR